DAQGRMMNSSGLLLNPAITIPPNSAGVTISPSGIVSSRDPQGQMQQIGQIEIVSFINPQGLTALGGNLYQMSDSSGQPVQGVPGNNGLGQLEQFKLESSNVNVVNEMVNMIQAQRAYEM